MSSVITLLCVCQIKGLLSSVLQSGLSGLKAESSSDEAGTHLLHGDDSTENQLQAALEQSLLKNIQYKVMRITLLLMVRAIVQKSDSRYYRSEQSADAIVLMCRSQEKPQKLSLTYECRH